MWSGSIALLLATIGIIGHNEGMYVKKEISNKIQGGPRKRPHFKN
jgi:hypothetical protein